MATVADLLARAAELAPVSGTPRLDAEVLLCHVLRRDRTWLFTWPDKPVDPDQCRAFDALLARRRCGEPVAYITGEREFWSLTLKVSPDTLIPRPETELLVETALARLGKPRSRILDLGTGTGAVALALAVEQPDWTVLAVDSAPGAVTLARHNAGRLGLANVEVRISDWFASVDGRFDLIVSNPPYIAEGDPHLRAGDVRFEPVGALAAGPDGLRDLRRIAREALDHLCEGGLLLVEHGADQGAAVRDLFGQAGLRGVETLRDLAGLDRVTLGLKPSG